MKTDWLLITFTLLVFGGLLGHCVSSYLSAPAPDPSRSRYHDATLDVETQPVTTPQAYYEREKAAAPR